MAATGFAADYAGSLAAVSVTWAPSAWWAGVRPARRLMVGDLLVLAGGLYAVTAVDLAGLGGGSRPASVWLCGVGRVEYPAGAEVLIVDRGANGWSEAPRLVA